MTELTDEAVKKMLDGATPGRRVQFHGSYCPEAVGTPFSDWDTSHDVSVIRPDGSRYRLAHYKHASDAYLSQMAPDLARTVIALHAELAQARADAKAAVAVVVEKAAENKEQLEIWAHEILVGLAFADVLKIDSYNDKIEAHDMVGRRLVEVIRALAPIDGLALVRELRAERDAADQRAGAMLARIVALEADGEAARSAASTNFARAETAEAERDRLAAANAVLEARVAELRAMIRVNMLRYGPPGTSHEEINAAIDAALATQEAGTC